MNKKYSGPVWLRSLTCLFGIILVIYFTLGDPKLDTYNIGQLIFLGLIFILAIFSVIYILTYRIWWSDNWFHYSYVGIKRSIRLDQIVEISPGSLGTCNLYLKNKKSVQIIFSKLARDEFVKTCIDKANSNNP
tara:strand:+ start:762 stop:1160 length:399 start_codon:yes stop_codon:yes gene_type:complete